MAALCEFFPGADTPINYDDLEIDDPENLDEDYDPYTQDSFETESIVQTHNPMHYPHETASNPVIYRNPETISNISPRPRSFVEAQVSKLQNLMAEAQPKTQAMDADPHRAVKIPQQFKRDLEPGRSNLTPNHISEASTPDTLQVLRSPAIFSESSSPRGISPLANYNIGNMNPRHIDIEQYWNRESDKSPRTASLSTTNSTRKEDFNQNYCDRLSAGNSPMIPIKEYNGNSQVTPVDARFTTPLQIDVDPVSWYYTCFFYFYFMCI